jgi:hypothetical protein
MQKVEGSSPFIRFKESPANCGVFCLLGLASQDFLPKLSPNRRYRDSTMGPAAATAVPEEWPTDELADPARAAPPPALVEMLDKAKLPERPHRPRVDFKAAYLREVARRCGRPFVITVLL